MLRRLKLSILVLLALFVVYSGGSWYIASQATKAKRSISAQTPASFGLNYQSVDFLSRDGAVKLKGWYIKLEDQKGVLIMVHGIDSNKADPEDGYLKLARGLYDRGIGVFLFDLRGHGESDDGKLSGGQFEQQDLLGAFDWLAQQGVAPGKIGVRGASMGGAITLLSASREPRLQAVIADSAFADISDLISVEIAKRLSIPVWLSASFVPGVTVATKLFYGIDLKSISPEQAIAQLSYPVLLIHSHTDGRIPYEHGVRLKAASPSPGTVLWIVDGVDHAKTFVTYPDEYIDRVTKYLDSRWGDGRGDKPNR